MRAEQESREVSQWSDLRTLVPSKVLIVLTLVVTLSTLQLRSNSQLFFSSTHEKPSLWQSRAAGLQPQQRNKPLCTAEQLARGRWVSNVLTRPPYNSTYYQATCGTYEGRDNFNGTHLQSYRWVLDDQDTCDYHMAVWNKTKACNLIKNATVLMMGDSLSNEHYFSLGHMLGYTPRSWKTCDGTAQVVFRRVDDDLDPDGFLKYELADKIPEFAVLNFGAHYVEDEQFRKIIKDAMHHIQVWQRRCKEIKQTSCQLIWRTTVPGHHGCKKGQYSKSPSNNLTAMEELVAIGGPARYHWEEFKHQNVLAIAALQESEVDFVLLDAYSINILRPDGHVLGPHGGDCLHSCLGSKIDVYTQALFHLIELQKSTTKSLTSPM